ncbi:hypothetical protein XM25_05933 [Devosia sp. H5989]|nr:hypothetical protein XM25_05933 [Devosia sp. H5989]
MLLVTEVDASFQELAHRKIRQCHWQRSFTGCASAKVYATVSRHRMDASSIWTAAFACEIAPGNPRTLRGYSVERGERQHLPAFGRHTTQPRQNLCRALRNPTVLLNTVALRREASSA